MKAWKQNLQEFASSASIPGLHNVGGHHKHWAQRLFWSVAFAGALSFFLIGCYTLIMDFSTKTTQIISEDRHASLDEVFPPSLVVCNNNEFSKSFVYWIIESLKSEGIMNQTTGPHIQATDEEQIVFDKVRGFFFRGLDRNLTEYEEFIKSYILQSTFYKDYVKLFLNVAMAKKFNISRESNVFVYNKLQDKLQVKDSDNIEIKLSETIFGELSTQWQEGQMIVNMEWSGARKREEEKPNILLEQGFGTSDGICSWITPMSGDFTLDFLSLKKGALFGQNHGLTVMLDAESYDFVQNEGRGIGFKVAASHPLDMPIIQGDSVDIKPGYLTKLGVSTSLTGITKTAFSRFGPYERKCWDSREVELQYLPYDEGYHYSISNCLFVAIMQRAEALCHCLPGFINVSGTTCVGTGLKCFKDAFKDLGIITLNIFQL